MKNCSPYLHRHCVHSAGSSLPNGSVSLFQLGGSSFEFREREHRWKRVQRFNLIPFLLFSYAAILLSISPKTRSIADLSSTVSTIAKERNGDKQFPNKTSPIATSARKCSELLGNYARHPAAIKQRIFRGTSDSAKMEDAVRGSQDRKSVV